MVRKVRLIEDSALKQAIQELHDRFGNQIIISNAEGHSLLKDELRLALASDDIAVNRNELLDVLENNDRTIPKAAAILGYFEAARTMYEYARHQFKENEFVLRMADIKQIHSLLMRYEKNAGAQAGQSGDFRRNNVPELQVPFKPIHMFYLHAALEQLVRWFNESSKNKVYDDITLAAITYAWFEKIHPFSNGNKRAGRILLSYILTGLGYLNIPIKEISKEEREKSHHCFNEIHRLIEKNEHLTPALVNSSIKKEVFVPFIRMISSSMKEAIDRLESNKSSDPGAEAVLPLRHLAKIFDYSQDYLRNLVNRGHVPAFKKGKLWYMKVEDLKRYIDAKNNI